MRNNDYSKIIFFALTLFFISLIFSLSSIQLAFAQSTPSPVSWWPADDNANDVIGTNHGQLRNGATFASGLVGNAFSFDGLDDFVEVPNDPSLLSAYAITVSAWIYRHSIASSVDTIVSKRDAGGGYALTFSDSNNNNIFFWVCIENSGFVYSREAPIPLGEWTHVTGVFDGYRIRLFVNGKLAVSSKYVGRGRKIKPSNAPLNIGRDPTRPEWRFHGLIDDVKIFDRALSDNEIMSTCMSGGEAICYYDPNPPTCTTPPNGIVSWWPGEGNANDIIGSNNGALMNGANFAEGIVGDSFNLDWDGINHSTINKWILVPDQPSLNITEQITLAAWIYRTSAWFKNDPVIIKTGPEVNDGLHAGYALEAAQVGAGQELIFGVQIQDYGWCSTEPFSGGLDEWTHVTGTYDGNCSRFYWNGQLVRTTCCKANGKIRVTNAPLGIGGTLEQISVYPIRFLGKIDEASIFNKALTEQEIQSIYASGEAGMCNGSQSNISPIANAGQSQSVHAGTSVTLDGTASNDPDQNYPLTFSWRITQKPQTSSASLINSNTSSPTFIADMVGDYKVTLVVTDSKGLSSEPNDVIISTVNSTPISDAGPDQLITQIGTLVFLDGSKSWDEDGDQINFLWELVSKPPESFAIINNSVSPNPTFVADVQGEYVIKLVVSDPWSSSAIDLVIVSFTNIKPVANAGQNRSVIQESIVNLDGSKSYDANLDPLKFNWNIVSKPMNSNSTIANPSQVFTNFVPDIAGQYVINLIVNDGFIDSDVASINIVAISFQDATTEVLQNTIETINTQLDLSFLKNPKMNNALTNKVLSALTLVSQGLYSEAIYKLEDDVLRKTDGCEKLGYPDSNDWITSCQEQEIIYPLIIEAINILRELI